MPYIPPMKYAENKDLKKSKAFRNAMNRCIEIAVLQKQLKQEADDLRNDVIEPELIVAGVADQTVDYNGWQVKIIDKQGAAKVDMKRLLTLLGPEGPQLVKKAMKQGAPSHYVQINPPREKGTANDEEE